MVDLGLNLNIFIAEIMLKVPIYTNNIYPKALRVK